MDLLVKAKTGTGKTMAFLVPAIEKRIKQLEAQIQSRNERATSAGQHPVSDAERRVISQSFAKENVGTLIISPTRELATQIAVEATNLTSHHRGFGVQVLVGGESKGKQMRFWAGRKDIVVATPGRLLDLMENERGFKEAFGKTQLLVLDEADRLLDMGFRDDIERVKSYLPDSPERQTFLFSATVSPAIQQIARSTLAPGHKFVNCVSVDDSPVHAHIPQHYTVVKNGAEALSHLLRLVTHDQVKFGQQSKVVLFLPTTKAVQLFADFVNELLPVLPKSTQLFELHSKLTMKQRTWASDSFRNWKKGPAVLVTSDVSARGVDYPGVTRVVQIGTPSEADIYIHRVGRTGRGKSTEGRGDLIISPWELKFVTKGLSDVPLKPLTVAGLKEELAQADGGAGKDIDAEVKAVTTQISKEAAEDTFLSLLGHYASLVSELGIRKDDLLSGLKGWMSQLASMSEDDLRISPSMLAKLGFTSSRSSGGASRQSSFTSRSSPRTDNWARGHEQRSSGGFNGGGGGGYNAGRSAPRDFSSPRPPRRDGEDRFGSSSRPRRDFGGDRRTGGGGGGRTPAPRRNTDEFW